MKRGQFSRLGVFGGTFDPPHYGHLAAAEEAGEALGLERVLFLPTGDPPHKQGESISSVAHRVRMTELAIADNPRFVLSRVDVDRPGASYTVDTLALLQAAHGPTELYFICGMDMLESFLDWYEPERVLAQGQLVAVTRPGHPVVDLAALERALPGARARIQILRVPGVDVSSTELAERAAAGRSLRYLTPPAVIDYIGEHDLYRSEGRVVAASLSGESHQFPQGTGLRKDEA